MGDANVKKPGSTPPARRAPLRLTIEPLDKLFQLTFYRKLSAAPNAGNKPAPKPPAPSKATHEFSIGPTINFPTIFTETGYGFSMLYRYRFNKDLGLKKFRSYSLGLALNYMESRSNENNAKLNSFSLRAFAGSGSSSPLCTKKNSVTHRKKKICIKPWGHFRSTTDRWIGYGKTWMPTYAFDPGRGESIESGGEGEHQLVMGMSKQAGLDILLKKNFSLFVGGAFSLGVRWAPGDSLFNRLDLQLGIYASLLYGSKSKAAYGKTKKLKTMTQGELVMALMFEAMGLGQRALMEQTLTGYSSKVQADMGMGGGGDSATFYVPLYLSATSVLGGYGQATALENFLRVGSNWKWALAAVKASGIGFLGSRAAKSGGVADMATVLRMLIYKGFKLDSPKLVAKMSPKDVWKRVRNSLLLSYLANGALMAIGCGIVSRDPNDPWGKAFSNGPVQATLGVSASPVPVDTKHLKTQTAILVRPSSGFWSNEPTQGGKTPRRGGVSIQTLIKGKNLFTGMDFMTPSIELMNDFYFFDRDHPFDNVATPTSIHSYIGGYVDFGSKSVRFRIKGAAGYAMTMGGSGKYNPGLGGRVDAEVAISRWGLEFLLGGGCSMFYMPPDGYQAECSPYIGIGLKPK